MQKNCGRILTKQEEGNLEKKKTENLKKVSKNGLKFSHATIAHNEWIECGMSVYMIFLSKLLLPTKYIQFPGGKVLILNI